MPCYRFYIASHLIKNATLLMKHEELHHMKNVMRIKVGEVVEVINGRNQLAQAVVESYHGNKVAQLIIKDVHTQSNDKARINLIQPLLRSKHLDLVVEKCTELGIGKFYLYISDQGELSQLSSNRLNKLTNIAITAIKQCGRMDLPQFELANNLYEVPLRSEMFPLYFGDVRCVDSDDSQTTISALANCRTICVGPEKGFSNQELDYLENHPHATGITINSYILRSETASIALAALASFASQNQL